MYAPHRVPSHILAMPAGTSSQPRPACPDERTKYLTNGRSTIARPNRWPHPAAASVHHPSIVALGWHAATAVCAASSTQARIRLVSSAPQCLLRAGKARFFHRLLPDDSTTHAAQRASSGLMRPLSHQQASSATEAAEN